MLKKRITKEQFEELEEVKQGFYVEKDGAYVLQVEDEEDDDKDTAAELERLRLKRKLEEEHRKNAEKERDLLKKQLKDLQDEHGKKAEDDHRKAGDIEALDKSWKEKLSRREQELQTEVDKYKGAVRTLLVDSAAKDIATRNSTAPDLLAPVVAGRLTVEYDDNGQASVRVLDSDGKPSALSLEDLEKEIVGDKRYASVIIAGKGSGGGSRGGQGGGGAQTKKFSEMSEEELIEWHRKDPVGFRKASAGHSSF